MKFFYILIIKNINLNIINEIIIKYIKKFNIILLKKKLFHYFKLIYILTLI